MDVLAQLTPITINFQKIQFQRIYVELGRSFSAKTCLTFSKCLKCNKCPWCENLGKASSSSVETIKKFHRLAANVDDGHEERQKLVSSQVEKPLFSSASGIS